MLGVTAVIRRALFGTIMTLLIATEFKHCDHSRLELRQESVVQVNDRHV